MAQKRKLNVLDIGKKKEIIDYVESHGDLKMKAIATAFSIPSSTLSTILKDKDKINERFTTSSTAKKIRAATYDDVDTCLLEWFRQVSLFALSEKQTLNSFITCFSQ
jgi:hypothetical protein